jgi:ubiquitin-like-conjugating enzyme ATG3
MLTIHPCKHTEVFKMFIERIKAKGKKVDPRHALFMFLKFIGSIIPTIKYDYSTDIDL